MIYVFRAGLFRRYLTYGATETENGRRYHGDIFFLWQVNRLENITFRHSVFLASFLEPAKSMKSNVDIVTEKKMALVILLVEIFTDFEMTSATGIDLVDGAGRNDVHQFAKDDAILQSIFVRDT